MATGKDCASDIAQFYPSAQALVDANVASRVHAKDATLYDFSDAAKECAQSFMGWADLASTPPTPIKDIVAFARSMHEAGLKDVVLIGQGGSSQAPMTLTKFSKDNLAIESYKTMDSDSPVRFRKIMSSIDPAHTLIVVSSKSGSTIEPRLLLSALRKAFADVLGEEEVVNHLVAITDPGSKVEAQAREEGWVATFSGVATVGGRFSALSVFGLVPAALAGIDIEALVAAGREAELLCASDSLDNPAIELAAFLYDNYREGRDKICYYAPKRGRVLGLWIEQLVAESTGKDCQGILPYVEVDPLLLKDAAPDRCVVTYRCSSTWSDEEDDFERSLEAINPTIPRLDFELNSEEDLARAFIMWEYATAMVGYLMKVCPFDQPDVASAKAVVLDILKDGQPEPDFVQELATAESGLFFGEAEVTVSPNLRIGNECHTLEEALKALLGSLKEGDYFAMNAFLPFAGEGRREALELIRHNVADSFGVASCLEVGPRYLHSTGQLQKGGPNTGVILILSADEASDIPLANEAPSLGALAKAQAAGDYVILSDRNRRCLHVHLPQNTATTLRYFASLVEEAIAEIIVDRTLLDE